MRSWPGRSTRSSSVWSTHVSSQSRNRLGRGRFGGRARRGHRGSPRWGYRSALPTLGGRCEPRTPASRSGRCHHRDLRQAGRRTPRDRGGELVQVCHLSGCFRPVVVGGGWPSSQVWTTTESAWRLPSTVGTTVGTRKSCSVRNSRRFSSSSASRADVCCDRRRTGFPSRHELRPRCDRSRASHRSSRGETSSGLVDPTRPSPRERPPPLFTVARHMVLSSCGRCGSCRPLRPSATSGQLLARRRRSSPRPASPKANTATPAITDGQGRVMTRARQPTMPSKLSQRGHRRSRAG